MSIVVVLTGMFHVGGAIASRRFEIISGALHTVGSVSLGAGIAVTGQIFHLSAHWPQAILLWAVGAFLGWLILRQWPQAGLTAVLVPGSAAVPQGSTAR